MSRGGFRPPRFNCQHRLQITWVHRLTAYDRSGGSQRCATMDTLAVLADPAGMSHDSNAVCTCVASHAPQPEELEIHHIWPMGKGGPDTKENRIWRCPTSHCNIHDLERAWYKAGGEPSWEIRRRYSAQTRDLARRAYQSAQAGRLVP